MKFKKLLFGLAAFPLLLTSCNNILDYDTAFKWVSDHYKDVSEGALAIATVSWDYHSSTDGIAKDAAIKIFEALNKESEEEEMSGIVPINAIKDAAIGQKVHVHGPKTVVPLNSTNFNDVYRKEDTKNIYKVNNGSFSGTYTYSVTYDDGAPAVDSTRIRVYNQKGYCVDFGCKISKRIDKDNNIKLKFLIHFIYEDDPID